MTVYAFHRGDANLATKKLSPWIGQTCNAVLRRESGWDFQFGNAGWLGASCPWRIIAVAEIAHADTDDGQKFGLPKPVDGADRATGLLSGKKIVAAEVSAVSGDLRVCFEGETVLELFNNSSGYEAWHAIANDGTKRCEVIAQGGGAIAMHDE